MSKRLLNLREELAAWDLDALVVADNASIRYLTGFTGSYGVLLVTGDDAYLVTDARYEEQVRIECPNVSLVSIEKENNWAEVTKAVIEKLHLDRIGFEDHAVNYRNWSQLETALPFAELVPARDLVLQFRLVKDQDEIAALREAVRIVDLAYEYITSYLKPGVQEREIALELDCFMRKCGAEREAFETIVASGPRSAMPHGKPTERTVSEGELIVLDFGARWRGYHSDMTRTVVLGQPDPRQEEIYAIVLEAQSKAMDVIRPGVLGGEVDGAAREYLTAKGFGDYSEHGFGHGLGLTIHDGKIINRHSEVALQVGMVITIEPGIYIPGWGGVRIEDDALVTESGYEILTKSPRVLGLSCRVQIE